MDSHSNSLMQFVLPDSSLSLVGILNDSQRAEVTDNPPADNQTSAAADLAGRRLGDFQILRRLGRGAMAEVYLAEQISLRRQVALKILKADLTSDATYLQRFQNEAMAAASLVHANIVQIHHVGEADGIHYIAQEYVAGRNLGELIKRQGPIDTKLAVMILRQVAAALNKAAQQGIVHRDIKPENIMLAKDGEVKVADFGLARVVGGDGMNLTQVGITMGTPLYMAPEQIEGKELDCRADLYALGVTAFHMLAGRPPFAGDTPLSVAVQHLNSPPPRLEESRQDLPSGLCRIVRRLMAKKPGERYSTPRELLQDLRNLQIDGMDEDWSEALGDMSAAEMIALSDSRLDATQQLDSLMKTSAVIIPKSRNYWPLIAGAFACVFLGGGIAIFSRGPSPLQGAAAQTVPKGENAWAQLYHAKRVDTEAAWKSVGEYFPENVAAANMAREGLVRYYVLQTGEYEQALPLLDELADRGNTELAFRAFGLAGRCVVLALLNRQQEAQAAFDQLTPEMIDLLDPQIRRALGDVMSRNRADLSRTAQENLKRLRENSEDLPE